MANYKVISTMENVKWPAYVSTVILEGEQLEKAEKVLEKCLVTLEAYGGPNLNIALLKSAKRTGIFLYEIVADLIDAQGEIRECEAMILNEPWMKANSIATATFEFMGNADGCGPERLVMKRKKSIRYYKDDEMIYEEQKTIITKGEEERGRIELETDV
ncbi:uncharacterized protein LOC119600944 [Lucilia sericata]|uniref:uncharacterized protein LOC119600944 n=1 Tax=Lucilia sericata TaxID=13632 RepID=UPI0018A82066|nr:uncharacterized protein LOC119600944 [Lucilia sericata]